MIKNLYTIKLFLERLDKFRDEILFLFIKSYWPRHITPNHLTIFRIILSIVLFVLLFFYHITDKYVIISLFFIGALTDLLDGSIARALNKETKFGVVADP